MSEQAVAAVAASLAESQPSAPDAQAQAQGASEPSVDQNVESAQAAGDEQQPAQPEQSPEDKKFAAKFAALSRKERQLRQQQQQIEKMRQEFEQFKKQQEESLKPYQSLQERLKQDPLSALQEIGVSYKDLTERYLLAEDPTPEQKQMSELESLKSEIQKLREEREREKEEAKKMQEELQKRSEERAKQQYLEHLTKFVNENPDYELIRANDAVEMIFEVMDQVYRETGEIPSEKEAADAVEQHFFEEAKKLTSLQKLRGILEPKPVSQPEKKISATLSNEMSQQVPTSGDKMLSEDESKRLIASMLKWNE